MGFNMDVTCGQCGTVGAGKYCGNCGNPLVVDDTAGGLVQATLFKVSGIGELLRVLGSLHKPVSAVRAFINQREVALQTAIFAYVEFVLIVPTVLTMILHPLGRAVNYPVMLHGAGVENQLLYAAISAVGALLGFAIMFLLPRFLFEPNSKSLVIATNLIIGMFAAAYVTLGDFVKMAVWAVTQNFQYSAVVGWIILIGIFVLQVYVWRRLLSLKWLAIVVFTVVGFAYSFAMGYVLGATGLWKF
ncbi:MAG: hypothetical protein ACR2OV_10745 [Hyphomicrobiaceae bacterium]